MNRRAQLTSQIIIFVIGLVVIGLVFLFGYQVINDINSDRCEVQRQQFGTDLSRALDRNKNWGTSKIVELQAPCETTHVCFVDRAIIDDPDGYGDYLQLIRDNDNLSASVADTINNSVITNDQVSQGTGEQTNVFTVQQSGATQPIERYSTAAAPVSITTDDDDHLAECFALQAGTLRVRMSGNGQTAEITGVGG